MPVAGAILIRTTGEAEPRLRTVVGTIARHCSVRPVVNVWETENVESAAQPGAAHVDPARAHPALEQDLLAGRARRHGAAQRLGVARHRERRRARQRHRGADLLGQDPAAQPARGRDPVSVGGDRSGRDHEAVAAAGERARVRHRRETALLGKAAPQGDRRSRSGLTPCWTPTSCPNTLTRLPAVSGFGAA